MVAPSVLPGRAYKSSDRLSRLLFHWRAADLSLTPLTGETPTFSRASAGGMVRDRNGILRTPVHSQPRFTTYDIDGDGLFEEPGLLLEGQRDNDFTKSIELDDAAWVKTRADCTGAAINATDAPDRTLTADKLVEDGTASSTHYFQRNTPALTDDTQQSYSLFAKVAGRSEIKLQLNDKASTAATVWFDLSAGTVGTATGGAVGLIEKHVDGWYRCTIMADSLNGGTTPAVRASLGSGNETVSYSGDSASGVYVWGMQFEVDAAFPSSPIITLASTVTRLADALTYTLPWLGQTITEDLDDLTVYARMARPFHADATGALVVVPHVLGLSVTGPRIRMAFQAASRVIESRISSGGDVVATQSVPSGAVIEISIQGRNFRTAPDTAVDVGAGLSAFSSAATAFSAFGDTTLEVGGVGGTSQLSAALFELKVARGLRTHKQMQESF